MANTLPHDVIVDKARQRIRAADVSAETKDLALSILPKALVVLGNPSVFWNTDDDSITMEGDHGGIEIWPKDGGLSPRFGLR